MMDNKRELVCSIDQGTSSTRVMIFDHQGKIVSSHQMELTQIYPQAGLVEHDPEEIWRCVLTCLRESLRPLGDNAIIVAVGITNQRETTVVWNKNTGKPYHNAIVWNDTRTTGICEKYSSHPCTFTKKVGKERFREKTGLPLSTYFSVTKLRYLLDTVPQLQRDAESGIALFGTIDTWVIWNLTNGFVHATDVTNASRTLLMNIHKLNWDDDLLALFDIPGQMLPCIRSSSEIYGHVNCGVPLLTGVPISGVLGDQHAALFGQTCFARGEAK